MIIIQTLATENWFGLTSADKSRMWKSVCTVLAVIKNKKRAVFWWYYGFLFSLAWAQDELTQLCHLGRLIFEAEGDGDKSRSRKDHSDLPSPSSLMRVTAPPMQGALPMQEERSTLALKTKGCWEKSQPQKKKTFLFHEIRTLSAFSTSPLLSRPLVIRPRTRSEHWGSVIPLGLISSCHVKFILDNCVCFSLVILSPSS